MPVSCLHHLLPRLYFFVIVLPKARAPGQTPVGVWGEREVLEEGFRLPYSVGF